jgi:DNA-binding CsgD family transcriptional regulator
MVRPAGASMIDVIETVYQLDGDEHAWLQRVAGVLAPWMADGLGLHAYTYDLTPASVRFQTSVHHRPAFASESVTGLLSDPGIPLAGDLTCADLWRQPCFQALSKVMPSGVHPAASMLGMRDLHALNAIDASGIGVFVGAPLSVQRVVSARERRVWMRMTSHLSTALRLLRRIDSTPTAVLSPTGAIEHAEDDARLAPHRDALRDAVARIEYARGLRHDDDPEQATRLWRPLVREQYTLVDRFEAGGRRYIVAFDNRPDPSLDLLTDREREVLAAVADNQSSKHVAYALGLSDSTVRVLLARSAKRLGLGSREALVAFYRAHTARH